jgi:hypothetical protein
MPQSVISEKAPPVIAKNARDRQMRQFVNRAFKFQKLLREPHGRSSRIVPQIFYNLVVHKAGTE